MDNTKIGFFEALCVLLIVILSHLILILPKIIIQSQGSASIINIIYVTLLAIFAVSILNLLYKKFKGMDILDISNFLLGKKFRFIIGMIYIIYLVFICSLLLRITTENLKTMYFQNTPTPYIVFFIVLAVGFINRYSLKSIIKCNLIIVPLIILSLIILFALSSGNFVFERVFPILGYSAKNTFLIGASNIFCFSNILFLFLIMPHLKDYKQFNKLSYTAIILSGILILSVIASLLLMFPISISSGSSIPLYLQTRAITFGKLIQRIDAFFVLIWNLNILSYCSIVLGFIVSLFKKISNIQSTSTISYSFVTILFGASLLYSNIIQARKLEAGGYKYLVLSLVFGLGFLILLFANIKRIVRRNNLKGEQRIE